MKPRTLFVASCIESACIELPPRTAWQRYYAEQGGAIPPPPAPPAPPPPPPPPGAPGGGSGGVTSPTVGLLQHIRNQGGGGTIPTIGASRYAPPLPPFSPSPGGLSGGPPTAGPSPSAASCPQTYTILVGPPCPQYVAVQGTPALWKQTGWHPPAGWTVLTTVTDTQAAVQSQVNALKQQCVNQSVSGSAPPPPPSPPPSPPPPGGSVTTTPSGGRIYTTAGGKQLLAP